MIAINISERLGINFHLHQIFIRRRLVELIAETQCDGRKCDVAIQIIAIDGDDCGVVQIAPPKERRVVAREEHERDDGEAPESSAEGRI